ncbi:MAG: hypothetical protein WBF88_04420 [Pusillimonas sp.]
MIHHQEQYLAYIKANGVGKNDRVASSPESYLSYLRSVAKLLSADITPGLLRDPSDVESVACNLAGQRKPNTINNYKTAMHHYVAMVQELGL